jgi:hypothetical protein
MTAPTRSRRGSRAAGTEEEGSSAPVAIRTMGEVALGFSSRAAAATATGMNARDPGTEDVDLRSRMEVAVLLAAMLTRLAATRDGAAMFTTETADMSAIGWTKFASSMAPLEVRLEGDDIRESYWSSRYSPVI